jgi:hypothetical protein
MNYVTQERYLTTFTKLCSVQQNLQAVKNGHLTTWPGLTEQAINKHLKMTPATTMVHMNQQFQNIRSTSKASITPDMEDETVKPTGLGSKTHLLYAVSWSLTKDTSTQT